MNPINEGKEEKLSHFTWKYKIEKGSYATVMKAVHNKTKEFVITIVNFGTTLPSL